jgi:hypothetical protein
MLCLLCIPRASLGAPQARPPEAEAGHGAPASDGVRGSGGR